MLQLTLDHPHTPLACARILTISARAPQRGLALAQRAWHAAAGGTPEAQAHAAMTLGIALLRSDQIHQALAMLEVAREGCATLGLSIAGLYVQRARIQALRMLEQIADPLAAVRELAQAFAAVGLHDEVLRTRMDEVALLNLRGHQSEALALAEELQPTLEDLGTLADHARLARSCGIALSNISRLDDALDAFARARAWFAAFGYGFDVAITRAEATMIALRREDMAGCIDELYALTRIFARYGSEQNIGYCEKRIGIAANGLGRYDEGIAAFSQARVRFQALGRASHVAECDLNLGNSAYYSGLFELALASYRRAEASFEHLGLRPLAILSRRNQALALRLLQRPHESLALLEPVAEELQQLGNRLEYGEVLQAQAYALDDLGAGEAALERFRQAETIVRREGNLPAAAESMIEQGWIQLRAGDAAVARELFEAALPHLEGRLNHRWRALYGFGRCVEVMGDRTAALGHYRAAVRLIADLRRRLASEHASSGIFQMAMDLFNAALRLAQELDDPQAVLELADSQRALALRRQMNSSQVWVPQELQGELVSNSATLREALHQKMTGAALDAALDGYVDLLLRARHQVPLPQPPEVTPDLEELRAAWSVAYPEGWMALFYLEVASGLLAVVVTLDRLALYPIADDQTLRQALQRATQPARRMMTYGGLGDPATCWATLETLGERLIPREVWSVLEPAQRLLIVPAGMLHAIPWATLRMEGRWLVEYATIQILPALGTWSTLYRRQAAHRAGLLVGVSEFGERAKALPGVGLTLDLVAERWQGPTERWENEAATREHLLRAAAEGTLRQFGLIHFAMHGQVYASKGLLAHLKLWDADLQADEAMRLQLDGALVVLSACETMVSEVLPGEEVLNLGRAFLASGARDVIASLWQLYDRALPEMLPPLYDRLSQGTDAPTALAASQRTLIQRARTIASDDPDAILVSPLVWGSLTAMGGG
ncbi:CHAT domain-containing protein [Candidatus Chloroploca sp. M-50]|uniref:CHAT domain-containing protein n=1 Tax=Candidatus Chloroploca mongolica TaxID=2528176 RepID=A0ABS4DBL1_9CHLR|nr:CHAT domain-containing protein [Candidatus Chloroploca mongolica]MBP1466679.1 CHAT domain-containing protein [Candidatus Chloroploca mongolica]